MKKYYLHNGAEQQGPFDVVELKEKGVKKETPIWYEGISEWTTAGKVDELKELFIVSTPPPFAAKTEETKPVVEEKKKKKWSVWTKIRITAGLLLLAGAIFVLIDQNKAASTTGDTYFEKVMTVEEMEKANPEQFLDAGGTYNQNFWGDKMKIQGKITNNATVANYKDVVIEVIYYSETETELLRQQYTIYDFVPAHTTKTFELKVDRPSACKKMGWNAISATPY
jgi:hypothetical protein